MQKKEIPIIASDELEHYLAQPIISSCPNPRVWWTIPAQHQVYPALSIMAIELLSIPAMSADTEWLFSSTKLAINDRRNCLNIESINAIECLKLWLQQSWEQE